MARGWLGSRPQRYVGVLHPLRDRPREPSRWLHTANHCEGGFETGAYGPGVRVTAADARPDAAFFSGKWAVGRPTDGCRSSPNNEPHRNTFLETIMSLILSDDLFPELDETDVSCLMSDEMSEVDNY